MIGFLMASPLHPSIHPPTPEFSGVYRDQDLILSHVCIKTDGVAASLREINVLTGQAVSNFLSITISKRKTPHWITDSTRSTYIRTDGPKF